MAQSMAQANDDVSSSNIINIQRADEEEPSTSQAKSMKRGGDGGGGSNRLSSTSTGAKTTPSSTPSKERPVGKWSSVEEFTKNGFTEIVRATKAVNAYPHGNARDLYCSFPVFGRVLDEQSGRILEMMSNVMKMQNIRGNIQYREQLDEKFELLLDFNDRLFERVQENLDIMEGTKKNPEPPQPLPSETTTIDNNRTTTENNGQQENSKTTNTTSNTNVKNWNGNNNNNTTNNKKQQSHKLAALFGKTRYIEKPQKRFSCPVDNSADTPFIPRLTVKPNSLKPLAILPEYDLMGDIIGYLHPYEFELMKFEPTETLMARKTISKLPVNVEKTPYLYVDTPEKLFRCLDEFRGIEELAIDVEHHSYRSFLGLTCLVQMSTRTKDYIFDALLLRDHMYLLNDVLTNPSIVKILHGADSDVLWLQRDLSLYIVNMFDTHIAAKALQFPKLSLAYLLMHYCDKVVDKTYQLADWRIRPLPKGLVTYARLDTHYLIYIYERLNNDLLDACSGHERILRSVYAQSKDLCLKRYEKPCSSPYSCKDLQRKSKKKFDNQQMYALRELYMWRDRMARGEEESYHYVMPDHMLLQVAAALPREAQGILACCNPVPVLVRQNLHEVHQIIHNARQQSVEMKCLSTTTTSATSATTTTTTTDTNTNNTNVVVGGGGQKRFAGKQLNPLQQQNQQQQSTSSTTTTTTTKTTKIMTMSARTHSLQQQRLHLLIQQKLKQQQLQHYNKRYYDQLYCPHDFSHQEVIRNGSTSATTTSPPPPTLTADNKQQAESPIDPNTNSKINENENQKQKKKQKQKQKLNPANPSNTTTKIDQKLSPISLKTRPSLMYYSDSMQNNIQVDQQQDEICKLKKKASLELQMPYKRYLTGLMNAAKDREDKEMQQQQQQPTLPPSPPSTPPQQQQQPQPQQQLDNSEPTNDGKKMCNEKNVMKKVQTETETETKAIKNRKMSTGKAIQIPMKRKLTVDGNGNGNGNMSKNERENENDPKKKQTTVLNVSKEERSSTSPADCNQAKRRKEEGVGEGEVEGEEDKDKEILAARPSPPDNENSQRKRRKRKRTKSTVSRNDELKESTTTQVSNDVPLPSPDDFLPFNVPVQNKPTTTTTTTAGGRSTSEQGKKVATANQQFRITGGNATTTKPLPSRPPPPTGESLKKPTPASNPTNPQKRYKWCRPGGGKSFQSSDQPIDNCGNFDYQQVDYSKFRGGAQRAQGNTEFKSKWLAKNKVNKAENKKLNKFFTFSKVNVPK